MSSDAGKKLRGFATDDNGTRELLESTLKDEENHLDVLGAQLDQIRRMGIQNYLAGQIA